MPPRGSGELDIGRLVRELHAHGVSYVVVGGIAAVLHGSDVVTTDLDICYDRAQPNVRALARLLRDLRAVPCDGGRPIDRLIDHRFLDHGDFFTFATEGGDLDCLLVPDGTDGYQDLVERAVEVEYDGIPVLFAGLDDLIRMKRAAGRPKDLIALDRLLALREEREALDES